MLRNLVLGILLFSLLLVPSFAQANECTSGEKKCDSNDPKLSWVCIDSVWNSIFCPDGCNPATNMCRGMENGDACTVEFAKKCNPADSDSIMRCENDGTGRLEWRYFMSCNGLMCNPSTNACNQEQQPNYECTPGTQRCTKLYATDDSSYRVCGSDGKWQAQVLSCPATQYCQYQTGLCIPRQQQEEPIFGSCNSWDAGKKRCSTSDSSVIEICQFDDSSGLLGAYRWVPSTSCFPGNNNELGCFEPYSGEAYCKQCAVSGQRTCWSISAWQVCQSDYRYSPATFCNYPAEICTLGYCEQNPDYIPDPSACTLNEERCVSGGIIEKCKNLSGVVGFYTDRACASNEYCEQAGTNPVLAVCRQSSSSGSPSSSSGGSGLISSGGGFFWDRASSQSCTGYTDWQFVSSTSFVNKDMAQCTNSTLERYCVLSTGKLDYTKKETGYNVECSSSDKCDYVYSRTEKFTDSAEGGMCRQCEREIYVYTCQPSGIVDYKKTKDSVVCGQYSQCDTKFQTTNTAQAGWFDSLFSDWAVAFAILLLLIIVAIAFLAYKGGGSEGQQEDAGRIEQ